MPNGGGPQQVPRAKWCVLERAVAALEMKLVYLHEGRPAAPGGVLLYTVLYMPATRTQIYLTVDQRRRLDQRGRRTGAPLAAMIREAVEAYLADDKIDIDRALEESFGILPNLEIPSRDEWDRRLERVYAERPR